MKVFIHKVCEFCREMITKVRCRILKVPSRLIRITPKRGIKPDFVTECSANNKESLKASQQAAKLRPEWIETHINIGASSFALGDYKQAVDAYNKAIKIDSYSPDLYYSLGLSLEKIGRTDEEILAYKRAVALKPDFVNAFEKMGLAYFKQKRYAEAASAFESLKDL